ncbi:MAG: hypothetical protein ABIP56_01165 [Dokdonella sp.]
MKLELFFMRTLFVFAAIASVSAMGGMLRSDFTPAQKIVQAKAASTPMHAG